MRLACTHRREQLRSWHFFSRNVRSIGGIGLNESLHSFRFVFLSLFLSFFCHSYSYVHFHRANYYCNAINPHHFAAQRCVTAVFGHGWYEFYERTMYVPCMYIVWVQCKEQQTDQLETPPPPHRSYCQWTLSYICVFRLYKMILFSYHAIYMNIYIEVKISLSVVR